MVREMDNDISRVLLDREQIKEITKKLGAEISRDYEGKNLMLVSILKGSIVFMSDLMRAITIPCQIDFMCVSSYGADTKSSGIVKIVKDLDINLKDKDLLLVEDILDTGLTLNYIRGILESRKPKSIKICTFVDKPNNHNKNVEPDYVGAVIPNDFVVGYGLDYAEKYRNLPYLGILKPEIYEKA